MALESVVALLFRLPDRREDVLVIAGRFGAGAGVLLSLALACGARAESAPAFEARCAASFAVAPGQEIHSCSRFVCIVDSVEFSAVVVADRRWIGGPLGDMRLARRGAEPELCADGLVPDTATAGEVEIASALILAGRDSVVCRTKLSVVHVFDKPIAARERDRAMLRFSVLVETVLAGTVLRRVGTGPWIEAGAWRRTPSEARLTFEDPNAPADEAVEYRVASTFGLELAYSAVTRLDPTPAESGPTLQEASYAGGVLTLRLAAVRSSPIEIDVLDITGRRACAPIRVEPDADATVRVRRALARGGYFLSARNADGVSRRKLLVARP